MAVLSEGQYELDGYVFGEGTPITVLKGGDVLEAVTNRTQDTDNPRADNVMFGKDYLSPPVRTFLLAFVIEGFNPFNTTDVRPYVTAFQTKWRADSIRLNPLAVSTLRWMVHGTTYRAYGRARDFEVIEKYPRAKTRQFAQCKFQYRDAIAYSDVEQSVTLDLIAGSLSTGITLPATLPWVLGQLTGQRGGVVDVGGGAPTPFVVHITGPSSGTATSIKITGPGWTLNFGSLALGAGQVIVVDTAGIGSAMIGSTSVAGYLTRTSTLTGRMNPGVAELTFVATDSSATTTATVSWRDAALIA